MDSALHRIEIGVFGVCERCDAPIEKHQLESDPLARICIECLSPDERRELEHDLSLASNIQLRLLPDRDFETPGWRGSYIYRPHGAVSGDFCEILQDDGRTLLFVGDISGKGVAAALLMSHLSAILRGLADTGRDLGEIMAIANRAFSKSIPAGSFATLVGARLAHDGSVELSNAGHVPPLVQNGEIEGLAPDGVPLGLFSGSSYTTQRAFLGRGDRLILVTDGLTESRNGDDLEFGLEGLVATVSGHGHLSPAALAQRLAQEADRFRGGDPATDDTTVMVVERR